MYSGQPGQSLGQGGNLIRLVFSYHSGFCVKNEWERVRKETRRPVTEVVGWVQARDDNGAWLSVVTVEGERRQIRDILCSVAYHGHSAASFSVYLYGENNF